MGLIGFDVITLQFEWCIRLLEIEILEIIFISQ